MYTDVIVTPEIKTEYFDKNVKSIIKTKMTDKSMTFPNNIAKALELLDFGAKIEAGLQE